MLKNKILSFILFIALVTTSCSEYQKVLNKGTVAERYQLATEMYEAQKFSKAIQLFDKIMASYRGKPQMERIQYMIANSYYNTKQYTLASYYFDRFVKNYPKSSKVEEAAFLSAHSYYKASPVYSLDQKNTTEAINALQNFIYKYPNSNKVEEANNYIKELNFKLEKKAFEIAKQYYIIEDYIAAVSSFDNFIENFLGTKLKEEAMYLRFKAGFELGMNSIITKKETRINNAIKNHERLKKAFPSSTYLNETEELVEKLKKELNTLIALKTENDGL